MKKHVSIDELKAMVSNSIREEGLSEVLDSANVDRIVDSIIHQYKVDSAKSEVPEIIPEAAIGIPGPIAAFPYLEVDEEEEGNIVGHEPYVDPTIFNPPAEPKETIYTPEQTSGNIPAYKPELPSFMNKIEPGKIIVFNQNELSESGENLSYKPLRLFSNPDEKKSMRDFWLDEGKKKVDVYMAKFEKIGEIEYDFVNGASVFREHKVEIPTHTQSYQENPYAAKPLPEEVKKDVDIKKMIEDTVREIIGKEKMAPVMMDENTTESPEYDNMIFSNLQTIKEQSSEILSMDRTEVDKKISDGHDWARDHISTSADKVSKVEQFFKNKISGLRENNILEPENYMFFQNLEIMIRSSDSLLGMDRQAINNIILDDHSWTQDLITQAKDDLEEVYKFLLVSVDDNEIPRGDEGLKIVMSDLVNEDTGFRKINTPDAIKEELERGGTKYLVAENEEVQQWVFNGQHYYTPKNKISNKKCYFKDKSLF